MRKDFLSLNWDILLKYLSRYVRTEPAKDFLSDFEPNLIWEKALTLREETSYLLRLFDSGKELDLPNLASVTKILNVAEKRGLILPSELAKIGLLLKFLRDHSSLLESSPFSSLIELYRPIEELHERLCSVFNFDTAEFYDKASYTLYLVRKKIRATKEELFTRLEKLIDHYAKLGFLQEPVYLVRDGRYVLPVKPEFKNKIKGIVHGLSQSGATVFIEPFGVVVLTNELNELMWEEEREINLLLKEITAELLGERERFSQIEREILRLDLAQARVSLGKTYRGILPEFSTSKRLEIEEGVHPLLYLQALEKGGSFPVPNSFYLSRALLITGPNLGGKTVSLKTIGLFILMAYSGFLLPAKKALIPLYNDIFVDMGDEQNLLIGESSFSAHLRNLLRILRRADERSLVLLDEPGRGTNPEEGTALVLAVIEYLLQRGAKLVVTTHSQAIKSFLSQWDDTLIGTMEFDFRTHQPTYRLLYGYWGDSHALKLAKKLGFDEEILRRAEEFLENPEYYHWQNKYWEEIEKVEQMKKDLAERIAQLEREREEVNKLRENLKEELNRALQKIHIQWQREFQQLLKELHEERSLKRAREEFRNFIKDKWILSDDDLRLNVGDRVRIGSTSREGEIVAIRNNTAIVASGPFKLEIPLTELRRVGSRKESTTSSQIPARHSEVVREVREKINLVGETIDSALNILEKKINECFIKGVYQLLVIHGHGTGRLRGAVRDYLSSHPLIETFEEAPPTEGGSGATLVYIHKRN